jgi:hypothetical protein
MDIAWLQADDRNCVTVLLCYCVTVSPERSGNNSRKKNCDRIIYKCAYSALQVIATDGNVVTNMEHCATDIPLKQLPDEADGGGGAQLSNPE